MRREQKLLLAFAALVLIPVATVWIVAWPLVHPLRLPHVDSGRMIAPVARDLTPEEARAADRWLQAHETGWGPSGERPPGPGQVVLRLTGPDGKGARGAVVIVSVWKSRHAPDVVGIQLADGGPYRMNGYEDLDLRPIQPPAAPPG